MTGCGCLWLSVGSAYEIIERTYREEPPYEDKDQYKYAEPQPETVGFSCTIVFPYLAIGISFNADAQP